MDSLSYLETVRKNLQEEKPRNRVRFFGSKIDLLTMDQSLSCVEDIIQARRLTQHVVINVAKLVMMQTDDKLREIVNSCGVINADGQGIVWGARFLGYDIPERVAGVGLFMNFVNCFLE